jgi:hypothetical protein
MVLARQTVGLDLKLGLQAKLSSKTHALMNSILVRDVEVVSEVAKLILATIELVRGREWVRLEVVRIGELRVVAIGRGWRCMTYKKARSESIQYVHKTASTLTYGAPRRQSSSESDGGVGATDAGELTPFASSCPR